MSHRPIIDAGPGLNFFSINKERLLIGERAAGTEHLPDKSTMHSIYERLRGLDDGLPPIEKTNLLSPTHWP